MTSAAAGFLGGTAAAALASTRAWWDEADELAHDAEVLRRQVLGLAVRSANHYGAASPAAGMAVEAGQTAAAGLLGLSRLLRAKNA